MDGNIGQILDVNHVCSLRHLSCGQSCEYAGVQLRPEFGAPQRRLSRSLPTVDVLHLDLFRLLLLAVRNRNPSLHELFAEVYMFIYITALRTFTYWTTAYSRFHSLKWKRV